MKTSTLIELLHKNDIDAITSLETLDYSVKYIRKSRGKVDIEISYYSNWDNKQITVKPFPEFDSIREAMMSMVIVIDELKKDK